MSIIPPDPDVIRANLNAQSAYKPFTIREAAHYNDPNTMQVEYGLDDTAYSGAQDIMTGGRQAPSMPTTFAAIPVAASRGEFYEAVQIFSHESDNYLDPDDAQLYGTQGPAQGYHYQNLASIPMPFTGPQGRTGEPAAITEVPTSTINPDRPRTVAAGYDKDRRCLTVVFRDGTYYNYYNVSPLEWSNFKRAHSKGRFILAFLDSKPRGVADVAQLPDYARSALYRVVRTGQISRQGMTGRQTAPTRASYERKYARGKKTYQPGNLGGTGRKRNKKQA